jgi:hypothetical protein
MSTKRAAAAAKKACPRTVNPFLDLLNFVAAARRVKDHAEYLRLCKELQRLGDAAMKCAHLTGHPVKEVEIRVGAWSAFVGGGSLATQGGRLVILDGMNWFLKPETFQPTKQPKKKLSGALRSWQTVSKLTRMPRGRLDY